MIRTFLPNLRNKNRMLKKKKKKKKKNHSLFQVPTNILIAISLSVLSFLTKSKTIKKAFNKIFVGSKGELNQQLKITFYKTNGASSKFFFSLCVTMLKINKYLLG